MATKYSLLNYSSLQFRCKSGIVKARKDIPSFTCGTVVKYSIKPLGLNIKQIMRTPGFEPKASHEMS